MVNKLQMDFHIELYICDRLNNGGYESWSVYYKFFLINGKNDFFYSLQWIVSSAIYNASKLNFYDKEIREIIYASLMNVKPNGTMNYDNDEQGRPT